MSFPNTSIRSTAAFANFYASKLEICACHPSFTSTVHAHMITCGFDPRSHILNRLIYIYAKSGNLIYARNIFDRIPYPDVVARTTLVNAYSNLSNLKLASAIFEAAPSSMRDTVIYNAMISGYARNRDGWAALGLFIGMKRDNICQDDYTFTSVLSGLALIVDSERQCQQFHGVVLKSGTKSVVSVSNALVSVYMKCPAWLSGDPVRLLFDEMHEKDELTWTTLITGYVKRGDLYVAKEMFDGMEDKIDVAWNAMISGYVHHGYILEAFDVFRRMLMFGIDPDEFTFTSLLSGCSEAGLIDIGKQIHARVIRTDPIPDPISIISVKNALITLHAKSGNMGMAKRIFEEMPVRDLVSWNAILSACINFGQIDDAKLLFERMGKRSLLTWTVMISGLAQNGRGEEALKLFNQMRKEGVGLCDYAFAGAFTACGGLGALKHGRQLHSELIKSGFGSSLSANNSLVTMYARCGVVEAAYDVFLTMPSVDAVSWNAMIAALGQHGHGSEAIDLFELMLKEKIIPDEITFLTILSACSHAGLIEEGRRYFNVMNEVHGITPGLDHYARFIDLLSRAGRILDAQKVIETMPLEPNAPVWEALLSGCRIHGNMEVGILAAEKLFDLIPQHDGTYVLLSNMYATVHRWHDVARVRQVMKDQGVKKEPGCSWIEVASKVHVFLVGDTNHPDTKQLYQFLEILGGKMKKMGYVPDTKFSLHDVEFDQKEYDLSIHSEKLAIAFGLLKLPAGATVRVLKNLRICGDCHNAIKYMSMATNREIVVRDGKRFHHFKDGECSCNDYW